MAHGTQWREPVHHAIDGLAHVTGDEIWMNANGVALCVCWIVFCEYYVLCVALVFRSGKGYRIDYKGILCDRKMRGQLFSGENED